MPSNKTENEFPVQVTLVRYDETEFYSPAFFSEEPKVLAVYGVYLFDRNTRTFCCESTPSHFLHWLRADVEWKVEPTDEDRERVDSKLIDVDQSDSSHYRHVRDVERFIQDNPLMFHADPDEYETVDEAIEYHQGNHWL